MTKKSQTFQEICLLEMLLEQKRQGILIGEIMTQVNELAPKLDTVTAQLIKVRDEIVTLKTALQNVPLPEIAEASLSNLFAMAQALDDLNQDAAPAEPAPAEPAPEEPVA